jgi:hypothetical protein
VTLKRPWAEFRAASVAVHDTTVKPNGNVEPDAGTHVTATLGSTSSVAETEKRIGAPDARMLGNTMSAGNCSTGA